MKPGSKTNGERDYFEIDRSVLVAQLDALQRAVRDALIEIAMVAAENIFDQRLSAQLDRKARALNRMARRLDRLGRILVRAKFPGSIKSRSGAGKRQR